jgi:hypothetical protein
VNERNNYLNIALASFGCSLSSIVNASADNTILVYPNPATNFVTIKCTKEMLGSAFYICDMLGRKVITGKLSDETTNINIENISKGIYFFQLQNKLQKEIKIIKN